jgi:hypothetical protein
LIFITLSPFNHHLEKKFFDNFTYAQSTILFIINGEKEILAVLS